MCKYYLKVIKIDITGLVSTNYITILKNKLKTKKNQNTFSIVVFTS